MDLRRLVGSDAITDADELVRSVVGGGNGVARGRIIDLN
jgi:hypothetical protein